MIGQFIDIIIAALLIVAIGFGLVLDRRVRKLTKALHDLKPAVDDFSIAVDRSEDTVVALRTGVERSAKVPVAPRVEPKMERTLGMPSFRSRRTEPEGRSASPSGVANVDGKADLVRDFFETARRREA